MNWTYFQLGYDHPLRLRDPTSNWLFLHLLHTRQMVEEKNTTNVVATLVSCLLERRSITTTTQFKPINVYTLEDPTTSAPKVTPPVSESSSSTLITLDQVKQLWDKWNQKLYERVATMHLMLVLRDLSIMHLPHLIVLQRCHQLLRPWIFLMACSWITLRVN
jgi:hypothetical protein